MSNVVHFPAEAQPLSNLADWVRVNADSDKYIGGVFVFVDKDGMPTLGFASNIEHLPYTTLIGGLEMAKLQLAVGEIE